MERERERERERDRERERERNILNASLPNFSYVVYSRCMDNSPRQKYPNNVYKYHEIYGQCSSVGSMSTYETRKLGV
jgi:hypothetical protein